MIKVCHIVNLISGKSDGVYKHLKMIFELSDKVKFEHFLIFQGNKKIEEELSHQGIKFFIVESLNKKISIRSFSEIYRILKSINPNIIHTHLIKPYSIVGIINIILRKKFIFNYHGLFLSRNIYYNFLEKLIYWGCHLLINTLGNVNIVLVPSEKSKELLLNETGIFPQIEVYYNGYYNHSDFLPDQYIIKKLKEIKGDGNLVAMVARLEIQKRIDRAIEIFSSIHRKVEKIHLVIFGDGDLKEELILKSKSLRVDSEIIFFDYIPNVVSYYHLFDLILFTSDWEGIPLTLWEAMANKIPVVAPDVGGFREILIENECGLIYETGNLKDAEENLLKILHDKQLGEKLGEEGCNAIEMKFNKANFINKIENIYLDLLK